MLVYTIASFVSYVGGYKYYKESHEAPSMIEMINEHVLEISGLFVIFVLPAIIIAWYSFYGFAKKEIKKKILHPAFN